MDEATWKAGEECEVHEFPWCALCKPMPKVQVEPGPPTSAARGGRFRSVDSLRVLAKYDGVCVACDGPIGADIDYIKRDEDGDWVHEDC